MKTKTKAVVIVALVLLMLLLSIVWKYEYAPYFDADLQYIRPTIGENENGWQQLDQACQLLQTPKKWEIKLESLVGISSLSATNIRKTKGSNAELNEVKVSWDEATAREILSTNQQTLMSLYKALEAPNLLVPQPKTWDEDFEYLKNIRNISRLMILEARADAQMGDLDKAFEGLFRTIRLGEKIQNAGGCFMHFMVGRAVKNSALAQLRYLATSTNITEMQLLNLLTRIQSLEVNRTGFTNCLKMEYEISLNTIRNLRHGKGLVSQNMPKLMTAVGANLMIREGKTRQILADKFRWILEQSSKYYAEIPMEQLDPPEMDIKNGARMVLQGNIVGEIVSQLLAWSSYNPSLVEEEVVLNGSKLAMTLLYYRKKNGFLPKSLTELIPNYINTVPMDHFDGKPFKYNPDQKLIYSIGRDLEDNQGESTPKNGRKRDISFPLEFPNSFQR